MMNIKSLYTGSTDSDQNLFCDKSDRHSVVITLKMMENSPKVQRMHNVTSDTNNAHPKCYEV